jgi:hypothetical protein
MLYSSSATTGSIFDIHDAVVDLIESAEVDVERDQKARSCHPRAVQDEYREAPQRTESCALK